MRISTFRKAGLGSCVLLAFLSAMPIHASPAFASSNNPLGFLTGTGTQTGTGTGTSIPGLGGTGTSSILPSNVAQYAQMATSGLQAIQNGGSSQIPIVSQFLNANSTNPSAQNQAGLTQTLTNIFSNQNINPSTAVGLLGGQMSGALPSNFTSALSNIPGVGNLNSVSSIAQAFQNPNVSNLIKGLTGGQQAGAIGAVVGAISGQGGAQALLNGGAGALGNQLSSMFPGAGGANSIAAAAGAGAQAIAAAAGLGGQAAALIGGGVAALLGGATSGSVTGTTSSGCASPGTCCASCASEIPKHYQEVRDHVTFEFQQHQSWFLRTYWKENILPALMLMAEQLSVAGILQVEMFGTLLDAKHQLETQRLFQELMAKAHKDYQPSEGMCTFGTTVRSLAASERKSSASQMAFSQRLIQRQSLSGDVLSKESTDSDIRSRFAKYKTNYCDNADNANGLSKLCPTSAPVKRRNIDVDYTRNIESRLTLDMDLAPATGTATTSEDAEDVFALAANLYSHTVAPRIEPELLATPDKKVRMSAAERYLDLRALFAKRSVAQNSFAAITSMRVSGDNGSAPYTKRLIYELGVTDTTEIEKILGKDPSYFAQMEVLTKKLYQNPVFFTELYDKPVNVERKTAAMQAIGLMQDRDLYNSLLRSEAVLSVLLETMLEKEQEKVVNAGRKMGAYGGTQ